MRELLQKKLGLSETRCQSLLAGHFFVIYPEDNRVKIDVMLHTDRCGNVTEGSVCLGKMRRTDKGHLFRCMKCGAEYDNKR